MRVTLFGRKSIPVWMLGLMIVPLTAGVVFAATIQTTNLTTIGGENSIVSEELTPAANGIHLEDVANASVAGTSGSPVVMTPTTSADAHEITVASDYIYTYKLTIATVDADQVYKVECYVDGVKEGTDLYVSQHATTAAVGDSVILTWDIGDTLASNVYEINVTEV